MVRIPMTRSPVVLFATVALAVSMLVLPCRAASAATPPQSAPVLLTNSPYACQMFDQGARTYVYCWTFDNKLHVKLTPDGEISRTATVRVPRGLGGPGEPPGSWRVVGRFRCEVLIHGFECVAIESGRGFATRGKRVTEVQQAPGVTEPQPVFGKSANLEPVSGFVQVKLPGTGFFRVLNGGARLPVGTLVDTSDGSIKLKTAVSPAGGTQTGTFHGGLFRVEQPRPSAGQPEGLTILSLAGPRPDCGSRGAGATSSRRKSRHGGLWGNAHGNFKTGGRYASATVTGTKWLTVDTCAGTLVRVARGAVIVEDRIRNRSVTVTAGHSYLARPRPGG